MQGHSESPYKPFYTLHHVNLPDQVDQVCKLILCMHPAGPVLLNGGMQ